MLHLVNKSTGEIEHTTDNRYSMEVFVSWMDKDSKLEYWVWEDGAYYDVAAWEAL